MYQCERCNKQYPNCLRRYIFSCTIIDDTSSCWTSVFNDQALAMLQGMTADEMSQHLDKGNMAKFEETFDDALFTDWIFKCKVKNELVGDDHRVKTTVYSAAKVNYVEESRNLLKALEGF